MMTKTLLEALQLDANVPTEKTDRIRWAEEKLFVVNRLAETYAVDFKRAILSARKHGTMQDLLNIVRGARNGILQLTDILNEFPENFSAVTKEEIATIALQLEPTYTRMRKEILELMNNPSSQEMSDLSDCTDAHKQRIAGVLVTASKNRRDTQKNILTTLDELESDTKVVY